MRAIASVISFLVCPTASIFGVFFRCRLQIPLGMVLNSGFLSIWRTLPPLLPRRWSWITSLIVMITVSLLYWLVSATCVYWLLWGLK